MGTAGLLKKWRNENFSPDSGLKSQVVFLFTGFFNRPTVHSKPKPPNTRQLIQVELVEQAKKSVVLVISY